MSTIAKSDIFFVVATASTVLLTIIFAIAGIYFVKIIKDVRRIIKNVEKVQLLIKHLFRKL